MKFLYICIPNQPLYFPVSILILIRGFSSLFMSRFHPQAKEAGSKFFGIQFFGECWGLPGRYNRYGVSLNCKFTGGAYVGRRFANYVYMLTEGGT